MRLVYGGSLADLLSRKASFAQVKQDLNALYFHRNRYKSGSVDLLAKQCFQQWEQLKNNPLYKAKLEEMEEQ